VNKSTTAEEVNALIKVSPPDFVVSEDAAAAAAAALK
jgi:hypothetical protein